MKNLLKFKTKAIICISILLISIASTVSAQENRIAIIDAGSSGSRLWVYEVNVKSTEVRVLFPTEGNNDNAKGPALSTIVPHQDSIKAYLNTMTKKYNKNQEDAIPLYILATAGMRMIPQVKADIIYQIMNKPKGQKSVINGFRLDTAMTISGQYEGLYAWIAANAKAEKLEIKEDKLAIKTGENTIGILEIGGASMQITFAAKQNDDRKSDDNIIEDSNPDKIYSKSYLHYGADRIFERLGSLLTPNCLISLDKIDGLYNDNMRFVGLSKPIEIVFNGKTNEDNYSTINPNITEINENRKKDYFEKFHPATNAMYIDWVVYQLNLGKKLYKQEKERASDWTEGAALDILINKQEPKSFNYSSTN